MPLSQFLVLLMMCKRTKPDSEWYQFRCDSCLANELIGWKVPIKSICTKLNQIRDGIASAGTFVITITKSVAITKAVIKKRSR